MITQHELHDLSYVLSLIRSDIKCPDNIKVLDILLTIMNEPENLISDNTIRNSLRVVTTLGNAWEFVRHENYYIDTFIFKNMNVQIYLYNMIKELKTLIISCNYTQAYDLADAIHALPDIIADNKGNIPNNYYDIYMVPYINKYMVKEQGTTSNTPQP